MIRPNGLPEPALFADPAAILARAFGALAVPERLGVAAAAQRYRKLSNPGGGHSGAFNFDVAPYLRRPHDCLDRDTHYAIVAVMGCAQSGKTTIGDNWLLQTVVCDPADMIMLGPDKTVVRDYVVAQINKMIRLSPEMSARLMQTPGANNIHSKEFQGCNFFAVWPVGSQMRARPIPRFRIEDFDAVPEDIDGEGSALMLLSGRQTTFEGSEKGFVNSSPALGFKRGIEAVVASGTDERWWVPCASCADYFRLAFADVLDFKSDGTPAEAAASAVALCPSCGGVIEQRRKHAMQLEGRWLGPEQKIDGHGKVTGLLRDSRTAGFRFDGLMGFASWSKLAELHRTAELVFEQTQDEFDLRAFYNSRVGINYRSRLVEPQLEPGELAARAEASDYVMGEVPPGAHCLTAAVDVQGNRFEVMVQAWGAGFESWIVDRFAIVALDGQTAIDPGGHPEHWNVLLDRVIRRRYPAQGADTAEIPILNTAIDTGGQEGVTENAFAFWYAALRSGINRRSMTLIKGGNNPRARLLPPPTADASRKARRGDPDAQFWVPNVHRFKNIVDVRLHREEPGPGHIGFPRDIRHEHLEEITAEEKVDGIWMRPTGVANETWDLLVYNAVVTARLGGADGSMRWVPAWAKPGATRPATPPPRAPSRPPQRSGSFTRRTL
jgi:phage terminase large subunit GpA-like protein